MPIAPSTYYAALARPPSTRAVNDERLKAEIARVHAANYGVYGIRKVHAQLAREGVVGLRSNDGAEGAPLNDARPVARCTTQQLMRQLGQPRRQPRQKPTHHDPRRWP